MKKLKMLFASALISITVLVPTIGTLQYAHLPIDGGRHTHTSDCFYSYTNYVKGKWVTLTFKSCGF